MSDGQFSPIRAVLFDPAYMNRQVTIGALQSLGLQQVEPVARAADLDNAISYSRCDLIIAEIQGYDDAVGGIVRRVRHRQIGFNPFVVILLTTWDLNADVVRAVLNSGADDLLARPYTIAQLQQRIMGAAHARKPFVVTADYVGPSRRNSGRLAEEGEEFVVPNTLRERMMHEGGAAHEGEDVEAAWAKVLRWKTIRLGRQLDSTATMLKRSALPAGDATTIATLVERITSVAVDLQDYALQVASPGYGAVADGCAELIRLPLGLAADPEHKDVEVIADQACEIAGRVCSAVGAEKADEASGLVPFYVG